MTLQPHLCLMQASWPHEVDGHGLVAWSWSRHLPPFGRGNNAGNRRKVSYGIENNDFREITKVLKEDGLP
jgi:hypothetical protein